jgi:hypothetical protein
MKKRNPLVIVLLSIITFGIYDIYWIYVTKKVLNQNTKTHVPTLWLLFGPAIALVVGYIVLMITALSTISNNVNTASNTTSTTTTTASIGVLISYLIFFVGVIALSIIYIIWFFKFSKAINEYTNGKMSTAVTFLILWLIHLIGIALIQDTFNDMINETPSAQAVPQSVDTAPPIEPTAATPIITEQPAVTGAETTVAPSTDTGPQPIASPEVSNPTEPETNSDNPPTKPGQNILVQ